MGATRNIVIRGGASKNLTEQGIRDDMEHIHNLVVISVTFNKGDIFISTNSVHNSLFARTCMMSRALYKGLKIDWYPDECALPIPRGQNRVPSQPQTQQHQPKTKQQQASSTNLYALLGGLDDDEDSESDDDEDESHTHTGLSNGVHLDWADPIVVG